MVKIKVCGVKSLGDALVAAACGADMIGFNFYEPSPRYVEPGLVRHIVFELAGRAQTVGVFVNPDPRQAVRIMKETALDMIQLHGEESPEFCAELAWPVIKALRVETEEDLARIRDYRVHAILIDARTPEYGGSGKRVDWRLAAKARQQYDRLILAGGLTPENVARAIEVVDPWGVDVASGVEREPGNKDPDKIERFIKAARAAAGQGGKKQGA